MNWRQMRHITGVRHLLATAEAEGVAKEICLAGSGITLHDLEALDFRIETWQELVVIRNLQQQVGRPGLGFHTGLRYHPTSLGPLGLTMVASATLQEAFQIGMRFQSLATALCRFQVALDDPRGVWHIIDVSALPPSIQRFIAEREIAATLHLASSLLQRCIAPLAVELQTPPPHDARDYHRLFPWPVTFNADRNAVLLAHADLNAPLPWAHADARVRGEKLCEEVFFDLSLPLVNTPTAAMVQALMMRDPAARLGIQEVVERLGLSERTLHRRLKAEGHTFQQLSDNIKRHLAQHLLREAQMDLKSLAQSLGYSDESSFTRAFRRWTGKSPRHWSSAAATQRRAADVESVATSAPDADDNRASSFWRDTPEPGNQNRR